MTNGTRRLVVVGGGILGTMHAVEGARRGFEVVHLERDARPRGASVRNFGLVWVSGRAVGAELDLALDARDRWESIAAAAPGTGFRANGSITVLRHPGELDLAEATAAAPEAARRGLRLLTAEAARRQNPAVVGDALGALFCERDAAVEPRDVLQALRAHLDRTGAYRYLPSRQVVDVVETGVVDHTGQRFDGDLVICCPGASSGGFLGDVLAEAPLRRVRLQMLETEPHAATVATSVADGDSMRYYPAFERPERDGLEPQAPVALAWRAQLLLVQRLGGHLTIGDTHRYDEPFDFDVADAPMRHLLGVAEAILGPLPPVERRWAGVYSEVTDPTLLYYRAEPAPGVFVVTGPGGRGMTMSPAIAAASFE